MKKWLLFLLKLVLTVACLWWALHDVKWPERILWQWVAPGIALAGITVWLTALRLWLLLRAQGIRLSMMRATELTLIGNLFNLVGVGGVGGDAARIFLLIRDHPERKLAVTLTVMFDHLVGLVAMALVFFALTAGRFDQLASQSAETKGILRFAWAFFAGGLVMVGLMFLVSWPPVQRRIHANGREWKIAFMRKVPELYDLYRKEWRLALASLAAAVVMLPVYYMSFWCGVRTVGSFVAPMPVMVAMPVVDMLSALPLTIAGLGIREESMSILMQDLTGMEPSIAKTGALVGFLCSLAWAILGGLLFLRPGVRASVKEIEASTHDDSE